MARTGEQIRAALDRVEQGIVNAAIRVSDARVALERADITLTDRVEERSALVEELSEWHESLQVDLGSRSSRGSEP